MRYARPPLIEQLEVVPRPDGSPLAVVSARVASVTALSVDIEVVHLATGEQTLIDPRVEPLPGNLWEVTADAQLRGGNNRIILRTRNEDQPGAQETRNVAYQPPPEPAPEVFLETSDAAVDQPWFPVRFRVVSRSPLTRVELHRRGPGGNLAEVIPLDKEQNVGRDGVYEHVVKLEPLENRFEIVAVNAGGQCTPVQELNLSYIPPAVSVEVKKVISGKTEVVRFGWRDGLLNVSNPLPESPRGSRGASSGKVRTTRSTTSGGAALPSGSGSMVIPTGRPDWGGVTS